MIEWTSLLKVFALLLPSSFALFQADNRPHILLVLVDDWGWNDAGFHNKNKTEVLTPNIDSLVSEGIELDRHYTYHYCSPSRATLQSGRLSVHVSYGFDDPLLVNPSEPDSGYSGIPRNMTGIAEKLKAVGYRTHMTGKWDAGMATWEHTPMGRGYETFFGYYHHAIDYYSQRLDSSDLKPDLCGNMVDLWDTSGPAIGRNGTKYVEEMFTENTLNILDLHNPEEPLFLFHSFHLVHTPLQIPTEWEAKFSHLTNMYQRKYAAMVNYMDDVLGQIVSKFKAKNMWNNTLMVVSSDNGGPTYNLPVIGPGAADNRPLRGGKMTDWEGGVRVNAFVSGGYIPKDKRGKVVTDYIHMADWYATFCAIAQADMKDRRAELAGLPQVDGIDQSQLLFGSLQPGHGPRTEIHHSARAITQDNWKLIMGGMWDLESHENMSMTHGSDEIIYSDWLPGFDAKEEDPRRSTISCAKGCLFDVKKDPHEKEDVSASHQDTVKSLKTRLDELNKKLFLPNRGSANASGCSKWGGFYGPFVGLADDVSNPLEPRLISV